MYENSFLISNSHVDNNMEMTIGAIVNALQDVEGSHIYSLKKFNLHMKENNLGIFLLYRQIDILKKPRFGEKITAATYPYNTNKIGGYRHIYLINEKNERIVKVNAFGAYVNLDTYLPTRIPKEVAESVNDLENDTTFENLKRKIEYIDENFKYVDDVIIKKSHIDRYNHVNNAHYITFVLDSIDNLDFNRIRAEYIKSFKLSDSVKIYYSKQNNKDLFLLKNQNNELCSIIELSKF